jgi:CheY-like chemotaxis protein
MKTILLVDTDSKLPWECFGDLWTKPQGFRVLAAKRLDAAVTMLSFNRIDLVVAELHEPGGLELLDFVFRNYPEVPVIAITSPKDREIKRALSTLGVYRTLEMPVEPSALLDRIYEELDPEKEGYLQGFPLGAILQMVGMERKTCTLRAEAGGRVGSLYVQDGEVFDAEFGGSSGVEAALKILGWEETRTEIEGRCKKKVRTIPYTLGHLLMEALRRKDKESRKEVDVCSLA